MRWKLHQRWESHLFDFPVVVELLPSCPVEYTWAVGVPLFDQVSGMERTLEEAQRKAAIAARKLVRDRAKR